MKITNKSGFTIIETMLFLAISGLFVAGVLIAFGSSLGTQRYRDTITTLQTILQKQFSDVNNPGHSKGTWTCVINGSGDPVLSDSGTSQPSGVSECVILGKYIATDDGQNIEIRNVVGAAVTSSYSSDLAALQNSHVKVSSIDAEKYNLDWGATLKKNDGTVSKFSILILRSPASGNIKTFISDNTYISPSDVNNTTLLNSASLLNKIKVCIKSDGSISTDKTALLINAGASNSGDVELLGDTTSGC